MGYARYGHLGKGLSDRAQQAYNKAKRATLKTGMERYEFDVAQMLVPGTNQLKGMYQLPGSPKYAGGKGTVPSMGTPSVAGSGGILTGYGGAAPTDMGDLVAPHYGGMRWLGGSPGLGVPPARKDSKQLGGWLAVGGLAYMVLKVLL